MRVVEHGRRDQRLVRHDRLDAVERAHDDVARGDLRHAALPPVDGDHVAEADRLVEQDREAGDVVGRELLQAEPDAHAERAAEDGQQREVEADRVAARSARRRTSRTARTTFASTARRLVSTRRARQALLDEPGQPQRHDQRDEHAPRALGRSSRARCGVLPIGSTYRVELARDLRQHAEEVEDRKAPDRERDRALGASCSHSALANRRRIA